MQVYESDIQKRLFFKSNFTLDVECIELKSRRYIDHVGL